MYFQNKGKKIEPQKILKTKVMIYQTCMLRTLLYVSEMWTT